MDDAFDLVLRDHALDEVLVAGVTNEQRHAFGQEVGESRGEIVDHDDALAGFRQRANHMTSDIAGAAGDKHGHELPRLILFCAEANASPVKRGFRRGRTGHHA